jgi:hypothetical protein
MFKSDREGYERVMKEQKEKYRVKDKKYYRVPSVHIDIYN